MNLNFEKTSFTVLLGVFSGLPAVSIDLSAPTLKILPYVLGTTVFVAGLTLSLFMVGFAVGQFLGGRLSDDLGRRPVLIVGLIIYTFAGMCCSFATSGWALVAGRCLQGLGAGSCAVQAIAIVSDLYRGETARRRQSYVSALTMIMPMVAPAIGAILVERLGWRSVHVTLTVGGLLLVSIVTTTFTETRPPQTPGRDRNLGIRDFVTMLRTPWFARILATNACSYGAMFGYIAGTPVVLMGPLGYSNYVYAGLFAITALALTAGAYCNAMLARMFGGTPTRVISMALAAQTTSCLLLVLPNSAIQSLQMLVIVPSLLLSSFARGVISPNMAYLAVSAHRENAGSASALLGFTQLLMGALAGAIVAGLLPHLGYEAVAGTMAVCACAALAVWVTSRHVQPPVV